MEKVFGTFELLEAILSYLVGSDLLQKQMVAKTFRETIQGSLILRQRLFLVLTPANASKKSGEVNSNSLVTRTIRQRKQPYLFFKNGDVYLCIDSCWQNRHQECPPFLYVSVRVEGIETVIAEHGLICKSGSCEQMYLCQLPCDIAVDLKTSTGIDKDLVMEFGLLGKFLMDICKEMEIEREDLGTAGGIL